MDKMLIWWTVLIVGVNVKSGYCIIADSTFFSKNDTDDSSDQNLKSKRQSDFNFDASVFEGAGIFDEKKKEFDTFVDDEDFGSKFFGPNSDSKKVKNNPKPLVKKPVYVKKPKVSAETSIEHAPPPKNVDSFSGETPGSVNEGPPYTTPYYNDYVGQPILGKPNPFSAGNPYSPPKKTPFGTYPGFASGLSIYGPQLTAKSTQPVLSQTAPYKAPIFPTYNKVNYPYKAYAPLNRYSQQPAAPYSAPFKPFTQPLTSPDYSGPFQRSESAPLVYSTETGLPFKNEFGLPYLNNVKKPIVNSRSGDAMFFSQENPNTFAPFPMFNSHRNQFPRRPFANDYQEFKSMPHLHFNQNRNKESPGPYGGQFEQIRSDVEVIDKMKPIPPLGMNPNDDPGAEEETSAEELSSEDPRNAGGDDSRKELEEAEPDDPFKDYDDKFSKEPKAHHNSKSKDDIVDPKIDLGAKFQFADNLDNEKDDDVENESAETQSFGKSHGNEEGDEEEVGEDEEDETHSQVVKGKSIGMEKHNSIGKAHGKSFERAFKANAKKNPFLQSAESFFDEKPVKNKGNRVYRDMSARRARVTVDANWPFPTKTQFDSGQAFSKESKSPSLWDDEPKKRVKDDDMSLTSREESGEDRQANDMNIPSFEISDD